MLQLIMFKIITNDDNNLKVTINGNVNDITEQQGLDIGGMDLNNIMSMLQNPQTQAMLLQMIPQNIMGMLQDPNMQAMLAQMMPLIEKIKEDPQFIIKAFVKILKNNVSVFIKAIENIKKNKPQLRSICNQVTICLQNLNQLKSPQDIQSILKLAHLTQTKEFPMFIALLMHSLESNVEIMQEIFGVILGDEDDTEPQMDINDLYNNEDHF
jgi:hypothetical protein